jgi:acetolactate synthase-1/3 small subunit
MRADARTLEQLKKQLGKTIDVVKITELDEKTSVVRELCLIRLSAKDQKQRDEIASNAKLFRAKVVDVSPKSMVVQLAGKPEQIDAFIEVVKTFGVQDISRTGVNAIARR